MHLTQFKSWLAGIVLFIAAAHAQAPGDVRVALVIGNSAYSAAPLANPANDAKAMSETLRGLGFTVIELRDGSRQQMADAVVQVREALKGKRGVGMLYYAGHGLQLDSRNYMVPVDARLAATKDVQGQTVDVGLVIDAFKAAGNRMNILVLDSCRDNPFGGITTGKGLAPLDAPSGTILAYATAPGNVAEDGDVKAGNGLYTQYLLQELKKPQATIESVFKRVRFAVRQASHGRQIPWESTSLEDEFQFNDGRVIVAPKPTTQALVASFNEEAQLWDKIKASTNPDDFYAFIQKYPNGTIMEEAHKKLDALNVPTLRVQDVAGTSRSAQLAKFRQGDRYEEDFVEYNVKSRLLYTVARVDAQGAEVQIANGNSPNVVRVRRLIDANGGVIANNGVTFDPPQSTVPGGLLQVGRKWNVAYRAKFGPGLFADSRVVAGVAHVVGRERVKVGVGEVDAFKIEVDLGIKDDMQQTHFYWYSPDYPVPVRSILRLVWQTGPFKDKPSDVVTELASFTRAPASP
ncbi:hypothetical protein BH11PSE7_BH11PSE7_24080 [soil metagenome]